MKKKFEVEGMTCTACAATIERSLSKLEGVNAVAVNFATEKMSIEFDESLVDINVIKDNVTKAG